MATEPAYSDSTYTELAASSVRDNFADVISRARYNGRITYVTRNGQRIAAIVPADIVEELQRREDADDIAAADATMARIENGEEELISLAQLKTELGL